MAGHTNGTADAHANGTGASTRAAESCSLRDAWALRNATAQALILAEEHVQHLVQGADIAELIGFIEAFSPTRSTGPGTAPVLFQRYWRTALEVVIADQMALHDNFTARGMPWMAVANAFAPERGAELRARMPHPAYARFPVFTTA